MLLADNTPYLAMTYKTLKEIFNLESSDEFRAKVWSIIGKEQDEDSLAY